jgi:YHS domain-containing protein
VTVVYKGKTIGFCCKDCVESSRRAPDKFIKRLD